MYIKSQEKRNSKLSGLAQSFFIMNYYAKSGKSSKDEDGGAERKRKRERQAELAAECT